MFEEEKELKSVELKVCDVEDQSQGEDTVHVKFEQTRQIKENFEDKLTKINDNIEVIQR